MLDPEPDVDRPPELEPLRDEADPDRLPEDVGVRDPDGGGGWTRDSDPPPDEVVDEPDEPDEPEEPEEPDEPDVVGRGIACAASAAGAAKAIATAAATSERGNLSMSMHSLRTRNRQGGSLPLILQQYCHPGPA